MGAPGVLVRSSAAMAVAFAMGWTAAPADARAPEPRPAAAASRSKAVPAHVSPHRSQAGPKQRASSRKAPLRKKRSVVRPARPDKPLAGKGKGKDRGRRAAPAAALRPLSAPPPRVPVLPPLGPERFYPHGIPELHPAFLHPLPGEPVVSGRAAAPREPGAEPEWLP